MADTRKDKRAPVSLKVRFKSATVDEFIEHYSKDVSRGGIYIKSSQPLPVGTLLKFQFQLKDESALIRGVGRVVWTRAEEDAAADQPAGMGIKFIKMDTESRATVERIVEAHAPEEGTYERGRYNATSAEPIGTSDAPLEEAAADAMFPSLPPAELPPPEDRTAVRQATQLLAAVMAESGTDKAAALEAEQKAEEARRRTEEIEAQRRLEAEQRKAAERRAAQRDQSPLPSMIVDPALSPRSGRPSERESASDLTPVPRQNDATLEARARARFEAEAEDEPSTDPPPAGHEPVQGATTSIPQPAPEGRRRSFFPLAVIASLLVIAGVVALRGGPKELVVTPTKSDAPAPSAVQSEPPTIAPVPEPAPPPPTAAKPTGAEEPRAPEPATIQPAPANLVPVDVVTAPRGAEVFVGDELRGIAPLTLELPEGTPVTLRVRAAGYGELTQSLTPKRKNESLKLKLPPLPYIVRVETTPPGAAVNVAGHRGTSPVELRLDDPPSGELSVSARLDGYELARTRLVPAAFLERDGGMRAELNLRLTPEEPRPGKEALPSPPPPAPRPKKPAAAPKPAAARDQPAAQPEPQERQPEPVEERPVQPARPAPKEDIPDNPFGD